MAYDLFLEQAMDNLDPQTSCCLTFSLKRSAVLKLYQPAVTGQSLHLFWHKTRMCRSGYRPAPDENADIDQIFARVLISRILPAHRNTLSAGGNNLPAGHAVSSGIFHAGRLMTL